MDDSEQRRVLSFTKTGQLVIEGTAIVHPGATKSPSSTTGEAGVTDDLENRPRESETPLGGRQAGEEVSDDLDDLLSRLWKYLAFASDNPGRDLKEMEKVVKELCWSCPA